MSKGLYHSELVKMGIIEAKVNSDVLKSQYEGKSPFVVLEISGRERTYTVENRECERALRGLKGRTVQLEATGSRDEAEIFVKTLNGAREETNGRQEREQPRPETFAEQQAREARAFVEATRYVGKASVLFNICYVTARLHYRPEEFPNLTEFELEDLRLRATQFLAIRAAAYNEIDVSKLPAKWPDTLEDQQEKRYTPPVSDDEARGQGGDE